MPVLSYTYQLHNQHLSHFDFFFLLFYFPFYNKIYSEQTHIRFYLFIFTIYINPVEYLRYLCA